MTGVAGVRTRTLRLYRSLLKHAQRYPSKKRAEILVEIKNEFRDGRGLTDAAEVDKAIQRSLQGLEHMQQFVRLDPTKAVWTYKM